MLSACSGQTKCYVLSTCCKLSICCYSVTHLCPAPCDPVDCSTTGFPVLHYLSEFAQTYVHWVGANHPTISSYVVPFSYCPQSFPASGSFAVSWLLPSGGQSTGASASASVLAMNSQGWFPLGLTGLISLLSKGLSRVFSRATVQKQRRKWRPTPVFLPRGFHGQRSLVGCSPWGCKSQTWLGD